MGLCDVNRRGPEGLQHHTPQMTIRHAQIGRELRQGLAIEGSNFDALEGIVRESLGRIDGSGTRRQLGATDEAGPEPGSLRGRSRGKEAAVCPFGSPRRAHATAVHPCRGHAGEEEPVETAISRLHGRMADGIIDLHTQTMIPAAWIVSPKTDPLMRVLVFATWRSHTSMDIKRGVRDRPSLRRFGPRHHHRFAHAVADGLRA